MPTPSTSELLAANVRRLREARGFSQTTLADRMGVAPTRISEIEHGRCGVSGSTLDKLADALACKPQDLLTQRETRSGNRKSSRAEALTA